MPPKKGKGRKRASTDDNSRESDQEPLQKQPQPQQSQQQPQLDQPQQHGSDSSTDHTDLLSPSEVVKMRKKTRPAAGQPSSPNGTPTNGGGGTVKEAGGAVGRVEAAPGRGKIKSSRVAERNTRKELEKKKEEKKNKKRGVEKENSESKKIKAKVTKKRTTKKKVKAEEESVVVPPLGIQYPCGICTQEVSDADDAILCEAGCEFWYHRNCTGMTGIAYQLLTNEDDAEWVCDKCIATKTVPLTKLKGE